MSLCFWPVAAVRVGPVCCSFEAGEDDDPLQRSLAARCISETFTVIYSLLSHTERQLDRYTHTHTVRQARNMQTDTQTDRTEDIHLLWIEDKHAFCWNSFGIELQYQPCLWLGKDLLFSFI